MTSTVALRELTVATGIRISERLHIAGLINALTSDRGTSQPLPPVCSIPCPQAPS